MNRSRFLAIALVAAAAAFFGPAAGAAEEPAAWLRARIDEVIHLIYDEPATDQPLSARMRPLVERDFDLAAVTRRAIGPGWRKFSPEQRQRAVELFSDLVLRTYVDRFDPKERPAITYSAPRSIGTGKYELATVVGYRGQNYSVVYRVESPAGELRITDVIIEGVSMIANYRGQFDAIFQSGGPDAILRTLEEKLGQLPPPTP